MMRYWKTGNEIYIGDQFGDAIELTEEEYNALFLENTIKTQREKRDSLLKEVVDSINPMRWELLTNEQKQAWRYYRQALLDVPQQEGFPNDIAWPEPPGN
jgi:5-methylthioribose kinase